MFSLSSLFLMSSYSHITHKVISCGLFRDATPLTPPRYTSRQAEAVGWTHGRARNRAGAVTDAKPNQEPRSHAMAIHLHSGPGRHDSDEIWTFGTAGNV